MTEYFTFDELPNVPMFRCERLHASLRVEGCASMWKLANARNAPEHLDQCKNCALGAKHAGVAEASLCPLRGVSICARCKQGTTRLVRKHLCVSCYNREREYLVGRNARGTAPKMHPQLFSLALRVMLGNTIGMVTVLHAMNSEELVVAALRDSGKQVTFGFRGLPVRLLQGEMFV